MNSFVVAKVLMVNEKGEILTLRRSQSDIRRPGQWDFPGGHVDEDEDMMQAAQRELLEETGLRVPKMRLVFAMSEPAGEHGSGTWLVFVAHTSGVSEPKLSHEHDAYDWKTPKAFLAEAKYDRQIRMVSYVHENELLR